MTTAKLTMTEEEKLELAKKLDEDLDKFIQSRQTTPYTDGTNYNPEIKHLIFNIPLN